MKMRLDCSAEAAEAAEAGGYTATLVSLLIGHSETNIPIQLRTRKLRTMPKNFRRLV